MFSGLTNQVSNMWSNAKGAPTDEEVPTPPPTQTTAPEIQEIVQEPAAPASEETPVEGGQQRYVLVLNPYSHFYSQYCTVLLDF